MTQLISIVGATLLALLCLLLSSCNDDAPTTAPLVDPGSASWIDVELRSTLQSGLLTSISFSGDRGLAIHISNERVAQVLESGEDGWSPRRLPAPENAVLMDLAMDSQGRATIVGVSSRLGPLVIAEREQWTLVELEQSTGGLQAIAVDDRDRFLATGPGTSSVLAYEGSIDGEWSKVRIPSEGDPANKSLVDLCFRDDLWAGCGHDNGWRGQPTSPFQVLMLDRGDGWEFASSHCGDCVGYDFRALAIDENGKIYLGGRIVDQQEDATETRTAFLWCYAPWDSSWTEIPLPDPELLERVNDILIAESGELFLSCGENNAFLLRLSTEGIVSTELAKKNAFVRQLAEGPEGIMAVGQRSTAGATSPLMLQRVFSSP